EIVIVRRTGFLDVFDTSGTRLPGFPVDLTADAGYVSDLYTKAFASPAVADLGGDGQLEIVCGSFGMVATGADWGGALHAFKADGSPLSGFPVETRNAVWHSPGIGNVDTVPGFELLTAGCDSSFYVVNTAGESLPGWPKRDFPTYFLPDEGTMGFFEGKIPLCKTPLLADCDGDGLVEILVTGSDGTLHRWDTDAGFNPADLPWPTCRLDMQRTGWYRGWQSGVAGPPAATPVRLLVGPNPVAVGHATLRYSLPAAGAATVSLFDASGRSVLSRGFAAARDGALELDVRGLGAGIYLARLESGARAATVKLVVGR
ncbi:T9SS type A sorting domain-containing protein, partial [candidate division WOR-3 bacterium]|nr:T9SS type A sorting domain-containing protein [candidate division WOR-3 bacterium]